MVSGAYLLGPNGQVGTYKLLPDMTSRASLAMKPSNSARWRLFGIIALVAVGLLCSLVLLVRLLISIHCCSAEQL
jgi:hypothetical protein